MLKIWLAIAVALPTALARPHFATAGPLTDANELFEIRAYAEALPLYQPLAQKGNVEAQVRLAKIFAEGLSGRLDLAKAAKWYDRAATAGNAEAQYTLGVMYLNGLGIKKDYGKAFRLFREAAKAGSGAAQYMLGMAYQFGKGTMQNDAEAIRWYQEAIKQSDDGTKIALGPMNDLAPKKSPGYFLMGLWYHMAAEKGDDGAQYKVGTMYRHGKGVKRDYASALKLYREAAEQGNADALFALGTMYSLGQGVNRDPAKALEWFRKAAELGDVDAPSKIATFYEDGKGVRKDVAVAIDWLHIGAKRGDTSAMYALGHQYRYGEGVRHDDPKAAKWYRTAAEMGDDSAQWSLGAMYAEGDGVRQDYVEAAKWYHKAAEQGHLFAQRSLALLYYRGQGGAKNYIEAHKWFNILAAGGNRQDKDRRDAVALNMTPSQIAEAQRLARVWKPTWKIMSALRERALKSASGSRTKAATLAKPNSKKMASTGSGFYVSLAGHILTNDHVVRGCKEIRIPPSIPVTVVARDKGTDLALIVNAKGDKHLAAKFRAGRGIRSGDDIIAIGHPLRGILASEANVTSGTVSALAGPGDDRRLFQITAPIQPGSSGGPVLDRSGNIVGVVRAKLNAIKVARTTGDIPQNVNFAVGAGAVKTFLDAHDVPYDTAPSADKLEPADIAATARKFTVPIECWK
jgi:uncharacterized protein